MDLQRAALDFPLHPDRVAQEPPEARGAQRSDARLLVLRRSDGLVQHRRFHELGTLLEAPDVLVVNNARVVPSILRGQSGEGRDVVVNVFSPLGDGMWHCLVVPEEVCRPGATLRFGDGALSGRLIRDEGQHIWRILLDPQDFEALACVAEFLYPGYLRRPPARPEYYQTIYASRPGATGLPSSGRHLTPAMLAGFAEAGVAVVEITLDIAVRWTYQGFRSRYWEVARPHADAREPDYTFEAAYGPPKPERYEVLPEAARTINERRHRGGRVVVCGTSALRILETVSDPEGQVHPGSGWTSLFIGPGHVLRSCDAFLTNLHAPMSTELLLTAAVVGSREAILDVYHREVLAKDYAFHEFGDSMLIL